MIVLKQTIDPSNYNAMDLSGIVPARLCGMPPDELRSEAIVVDGANVRLGDYFDVQASSEEQLLVEGDLHKCIRVGGGMAGGLLTIQGSVGDELGRNMRGGILRVQGNCGRFAASGLRGGLIHVQGNAGEYAAGARPGKDRGMNGGKLLIEGDCERWLAARMRRGLVMVQGDVQAGCAARMIAGTIVLAGRVEGPLGFNMKRGTLLRLGRVEAEPMAVLSGFTEPQFAELSFLPLLIREVGNLLDVHLDSSQFARCRVVRSVGDRALGGIGECIWLPTDEPSPMPMLLAKRRCEIVSPS